MSRQRSAGVRAKGRVLTRLKLVEPEERCTVGAGRPMRRDGTSGAWAASLRAGGRG